MKGETVNINVLDPLDYTSITVTLNNTTVYSSNNIVPFSLTNVQPGLYTITASGGQSPASVGTFFVVNATGSFNTNTGVLTFSSTNATPVLVNVYSLPSDRVMVLKPIILTDADR